MTGPQQPKYPPRQRSRSPRRSAASSSRVPIGGRLTSEEMPPPPDNITEEPHQCVCSRHRSVMRRCRFGFARTSPLDGCRMPPLLWVCHMSHLGGPLSGITPASLCHIVLERGVPRQEGQQWVKDMFDRIEMGMMHAIDVSRSVLDAMTEEHERFLRIRAQTGL